MNLSRDLLYQLSETVLGEGCLLGCWCGNTIGMGVSALVGVGVKLFGDHCWGLTWWKRCVLNGTKPRFNVLSLCLLSLQAFIASVLRKAKGPGAPGWVSQLAECPTLGWLLVSPQVLSQGPEMEPYGRYLTQWAVCTRSSSSAPPPACICAPSHFLKINK